MRREAGTARPDVALAGAADFRADFDLQNRLDFTIGHHLLGKISSGDLLGLDGNDRFAFAKDGQQR